MRTTVTLLALLTLAVPAVAQNSAPEGHIHPIELEKMLLDGKPIPTPPFLPGADPESLIDQATVFRGISAQQREGTEGILGGDLNGDGYDDIVTSFGSGTSSANRVYIRFGGPSISPSPDVTIQTDGTFSFGTELSDAGDLNGDGYADFFIGAFNNGAPGRGFVFFGRSAWPSVLSAATDADLILQPSGSTTSRFGWEADGVGDINADGHGDLVVGDFTGTAYVFFGGAAMDATPDLTLSGFSGLGYYVAGVGDLNQDGHPDFALGSTSAGALVYHGGPSLDATADLIVNVPGTTFMRVEGGGDVNGDGAPDLLMGTWSYDRPTLPDAGAVFVAYGGATMDNVVDVTIEGTQSGGDLGWTLSPLYDLDGDGYADILAGERDYNGALGLRQGRVSLYRGGPSMDGRPDAVFEGDEASDFFGQNAVSMGGDTDGDGYGEILVSATNFGSFGESRLYRIGFSGDDVADLNVRRSFEEGYGSSIAVIDANNDGYDDVVVGAYLDDTGADAAGAVRIYYGGPLYDAEHDVLLYATQANASFGWRVANAGDMNRDGYDDLLVSATGAGVSTGGQAYVFLGGPSLSGTLTTASAAVTLQPGGIGFESVDFGSEVATGGDFNGDGYADVVVADNQENDDTGSTTRFAQGAAYVFFGGATLNGAHDVKVTGRYYNDDVDGSNNAGSGLAMGDYNADGFTDVAVGASGVDGDDSGVTRQRVGFVGVLFGRSRSATDPALDFRLVNLSGLFGFSDDGLLGVSAATVDLNGDSIDDLAMGSFVDVNGNDDAGRLYLTYGSATDFDVRDYTLTSSGTGAFEYYSWTLAPGGDLNGDGYEDLLLGSYSYYDYDVYALYGGPRPDGQRDVRMPKPFGFFSRFALASGDINGDGLSDALTGDSYAYDNSASWADVSIYLSTPPALRPGLWVVRDVPGDQGGFVRLEWTRSGFDTAGGDIEEYRVYRAATPGPGGLAWEQIATVSPSALPRYAYTAATTSDQTPTNSGLFYFRVGAVIDRTFGQQDEVFYSLMRSGASADNLSPAAPATLALTQSPDGDVALTWDEVTGEPDLFGYDVFQSSTEACDATATLVGTAEGETTVTFEDDATAFGT
ncbi:MAG: VCBS repeat-containing protein, partial [Bacteroidota bacterium]